MAEQVAKMVIKVDLQCRRCYKKIKKILCEIPQVKDRIFDEKQNTVTITVVCCSPEKVRQKICCKGRDFILGIDIIPPKQERLDPGTKEPGTKDQSTQTTQTKEVCPTLVAPPAKRVPPPPLIGNLPVFVMGGGLYICPPCHNWGCSQFCPCNCHCRRPLMCHDGCGRPANECRCARPPMCTDGCGRLAHECRCRRPSYPRCCDQCNEGSASLSWMPHSCDHGRPSACSNASYECESSCSFM